MLLTSKTSGASNLKNTSCQMIRINSLNKYAPLATYGSRYFMLLTLRSKIKNAPNVKLVLKGARLLYQSLNNSWPCDLNPSVSLSPVAKYSTKPLQASTSYLHIRVRSISFIGNNVHNSSSSGNIWGEGGTPSRLAECSYSIF